MLKTSESIESKTRPEKSGVGVEDDNNDNGSQCYSLRCSDEHINGLINQRNLDSSWLIKRGSNDVCVLWSVIEPSQNKKKKASLAKTEGGKQCVILEDDDLDTRKWLFINALLELTTKQIKVTQTKQNILKKLCHPINTSTCFLACCLSHAIILLVYLIKCYYYQMSVSLLTLKYAFLTLSHYNRVDSDDGHNSDLPLKLVF